MRCVKLLTRSTLRDTVADVSTSIAKHFRRYKMTPAYLLSTLLCLLCVFWNVNSTDLSDQLDALQKYFKTDVSSAKSTTTGAVRDHFHLIDQERILLNTLWKYIESENSRLEELQKFRNVLTKNEEVQASPDDLAHNPLSVYITVKHLTVDSDEVNRKMKKNSYYDIVPEILRQENLILPDENDLYDEICDLVLLQKVYNFTVRDLMGGHVIPNTTIGFALTAEDCFYIGKRSSEMHDHETAVKWLWECKHQFSEYVRSQAYEILMSSALFVGNYKLCTQMVYHKLSKDLSNRVLNDLKIQLSKRIESWSDDHARDQYESFNTCAGDYEADIASRNLKCRYNHHNSAFLTVAPLKEEMLSVEPKISVFRDAVFDSEIELLTTEAHDLFEPASILNTTSKTGRSIDTNYRPSRTTFLNNEQAKYISLRNRLQDMGALSLKQSEFYQMLHYASGGFYRVHGDFNEALPGASVKGNRLATALMYLNDVLAGGHTVFPRLRIKVQPVKGSVLFWINMKADGSEEMLARHAACPVIYGEKLACTQWYRSRGQDHWIAEPEGDKKTHYFRARNITCRVDVAQELLSNLHR